MNGCNVILGQIKLDDEPELDEDYDDTAAGEQGNLPGDGDW